MADTASAAANGTGAVSAPATGNAGLYNPEEAGRKLLELDALVPQVAVALHQDKFKQVQVRRLIGVMGGGMSVCLSINLCLAHGLPRISSIIYPRNPNDRPSSRRITT